MASGSHKMKRIILPTTIKRLNHEDYIHYMEYLKSLDISKFIPPSWLQHTETPFKWAQDFNPKNMMRHDTDTKLEDYPEEDLDGCYTFEKFSLHLLKVFQSVLIDDHENAKQSLQILENFFEKISKHKADIVYNRIGEAFKHVLLAVTAQVSFLNGNLTEQESQNIASNLFPFSRMDPSMKAGIVAIKAKFYTSCSDSSTIALKYFEEAVQLDPKFAPWLYWSGKLTRKLRRSKREGNPEKEISYFQQALEMKKDPKYILFLAQGCREKSQYLHNEQKSSGSNNIESRDEKNALIEKSLELYKECWNLKKDSAAINRRLGNGIMSLKNPDLKLAKESLSKALKISNEPITYHILGSFYLKYNQDYLKAVEYFTKGAENGLMHCYNELVRLKYALDDDYDPYEDLKIVEHSMRYSFDLPTLYGDLGWYYLAIKPDLCKAVEYFLKTFEMKDDPYLKRFRCYTFFVNDYINIYSILKKEALDLKEKNKERDLDDLIIEKLLNKIAENPDLVCQNIGEVSLVSVKNASQRSKNKLRKSLKLNKSSININPKGSGYWNNQFKERKHCTAEESVYSSRSYNNRKPTNWRNEQREMQSFNSRNVYSFHNQRPSDENKICNWRLECKDN